MAGVPLLNDDRTSVSDDFDVSEKLPGMSKRRKLFRKENIGWAVLACGLLGLTIGIAAGIATLVVLNWKGIEPSPFQKTSAPSPLTQDMDISYHWQQFNGSFMQENIYRQKASPEVDEAWEALGINYRSVLIPQELAPKVGLDSEKVQINPKYGGGFPANVEGLHHLHCLNLLRQGLYYNIEYYRKLGTGAFVNEEPIVQRHISHCLDIIRQQLMCQVDVGVLGQVWWKSDTSDAPQAFVDFNTKHVCRNYDEIRQWAEDRQLPETVPDDYLAPPKPGQKILDHVP